MYSDIDALEIKVGNSYVLKVSKFFLTEEKRKDKTYTHVVPELTYFTNGKAVYEIEELKYEVCAGNVFCLPAGVKHKVEKIEEPLEFINIWFDVQLLDLFDKVLIERSEHLFQAISANHLYKLQNDDMYIVQIKRVINEIFKESEGKNTAYFQIVKSQLGILVALLLRIYGITLDADMVVGDKRYVYIEKSMEYINDNIGEKFTLTHLADLAHMSPRYYCTFFKKVNGISPWEYITRKKIVMAQEILSSTDKTIIEVAFECGFNTAANFNRAFKKHVGYTPSEFKKGKTI